MTKNKTFRTILEIPDITSTDILAQPLDLPEVSSQKIHLLSPKNNFVSGRTNYGVHFMYQEQPITRIKLTFKAPGRYKLENIQIFCQKMNRLSELREKRLEEAPRDLSIDGNHITCAADFSKDRELILSIPYSKGWRLYVDGKNHPVHLANRMFLGAKIPEGEHQIEFIYMTPGLPAGIAATLTGLLLFLKIFLFQRKQRHLSFKSPRISGKTSICPHNTMARHKN